MNRVETTRTGSFLPDITERGNIKDYTSYFSPSPTRLLNLQYYTIDLLFAPNLVKERVTPATAARRRETEVTDTVEGYPPIPPHMKIHDKYSTVANKMAKPST